MNIFFRLGEWWEARRKVRFDEWQASMGSMAECLKERDERISRLDLAIQESSKVPTGTANEMKGMRIRLDQLELYVGLKRDKKPESVPGAPRIG